MTSPPFRRILVANRGEIALRVIRTAREMGIETVAVYSDADRTALHVRRADHAVRIGSAAPRDSYLRIDAILAACKKSGAEAVHPGYGFLSENAAFSQACEDAGVVFIGPRPFAIKAMGDKVEARKIAEKCNVPLVPGLKEDVRDEAMLIATAKQIGYPVMLKAAAGGGGKGIRIVNEEKELLQAASLARAEAKGAFGDDRIYLEKFVTRPRHVEIQILADSHGDVVHFGERECSVQRRHQKLVEESPCVALTPELRAQMGEAACRLARAVQYRGAGTVEFLYSEGRFYFLEVNTRLQVEHPITEARFGVDLVREQILVAAGGHVPKVPEPRGHAIEVRVNAEDPETFFPSLGTITRLQQPGGPGVRVDGAMYRGLEITPHYDSMLSKLIVWAPDRAQATARMVRALQELRIVGVATSVPTALKALRSAEWQSGDYDTAILQRVQERDRAKLLEIASLAAALAKFRGTERTSAGGGSGAPSAGVPAWVAQERADRLGRRART